MSVNAAHENYYPEIFAALLASEALKDLASELGKAQRTIVLSGLTGSAKALIIAAIEKHLNRRIVFITRSNREIDEALSDVQFFYCALNGLDATDGRVLPIPALENDPYDGPSPHAEVLEQRSLALHRAYEGAARILLTSIDAVAERTVAPALLKAASITLRTGEDMPPELIVDLLISSGYVRQE